MFNTLTKISEPEKCLMEIENQNYQVTLMIIVHSVCIILMGIELITPYLPISLLVFEHFTLVTVILYQVSIFYLISKSAEEKVCSEAHGQTG